TEDMLIDARPKTNASLLWVVAEEWRLWTTHRTPDLKMIIQEIVNRDNWEVGNALALILLGENQGPSDVENAREFESYENIADPEDGGDGQNHPERRPRLLIYYSSPNTVTSTRAIFTPDVKALKVYPNPANSASVTIELDADAASVIRLYNVNGQLIRTQQSDFGKQIQLPVDNLPQGVYFIQANQNGERYIQKLVIEK
ncbi:MAG: T9SS type A sorting domain-containing protein, partial [Saprospiraceae bacterium]|nr:T9SS type A sorting domain-containing protein [Saprospiraceae bacterium]